MMMILFIGTHSVTTTLNVHSRILSKPVKSPRFGPLIMSKMRVHSGHARRRRRTIETRLLDSGKTEIL